MSETLRMQAAGSGVKRVMRGDRIIGFALGLSNGKWGAFTRDDVPATATAFSKPTRVLEWFERNEPAD